MLGDGAGHWSLFGAGVEGSHGFDEGDPGLFGGRGIVADAARDDEELAGSKRDRAAIGFSSSDGEEATEDEEHLVLEFVGVPGKFS